MELLGLLAIGIVIGIPTIAIIALVRSRAAERRIEECWYQISDLQGDIAGLRREVAGFSDRVNKPETTAAAPHDEDREVSRAPEPMAAPAIREEVQVIHTQSSQPVAGSSWPDAATIPPGSAPTPEPSTGLEGIKRRAPAGIAALQPVVLREAVRKEETTPTATSPSAERPLTSPAPAAPPPASVSSFAQREAAPPQESVFQRLRTNLPLEQFLGMNLFAKIGIVLLVLGLALLGRMVLIAIGPGPRVVLTYGIAGIMLGGGIWLERRERYRLLGRTGIGGG
jgi:hypothetical protein